MSFHSRYFTDGITVNCHIIVNWRIALSLLPLEVFVLNLSWPAPSFSIHRLPRYFILFLFYCHPEYMITTLTVAMSCITPTIQH